MTTTHTLIDFYAGDDWEIRATLLDENGLPYNIPPADIQWALLDQRSQRVINGAEVTITATDGPAGKYSIMVPATATSPLADGMFTTRLRVTNGGVKTTLLSGPVHVIADAFK
jgi:hypothetical protein